MCRLFSIGICVRELVIRVSARKALCHQNANRESETEGIAQRFIPLSPDCQNKAFALT
jgi:hypothetical protein